MSVQDGDPPRNTEPREEHLIGIPHGVHEIRKAFCTLTLKSAEIEMDGQTLKSIIISHETRFITWMMANDAHLRPGASYRSLEHWRTWRPHSYRIASTAIMNANSILGRIYHLLNEPLGEAEKAVLDLHLRNLRDTLKSLEDVTADR